jgi:hypothetical protein
LPDSTGAVADTTKGAYFTEDGLFQIVLWDGDQWQDDGEPVSTKGYVDDRVSLFTETITVNVPSDHPTLQDAFDAIRRQRPDKSNIQVVVNIEEGHAPESGVLLQNGDYSHVRLSSEDETVSLAGAFSGIFLDARNIRGLVFDVKIDMDGNGLSGIVLTDSKIMVTNGSGVINSSRKNIFVNRNSELASDTNSNEDGAIFTGAGEEGVYCDHLGRVFLRNLDVSGSFIGIRGRAGARLDCPGLLASNCTEQGVLLDELADLICPGTTLRKTKINNNGAEGILARDVCTISAPRVISDRELEVKDNTKQNIRLVRKCKMSFDNAVCTGAGTNAIEIDGSEIVGQGVDFTGAGQGKAGADGDMIRLLNGAKAILRNANFDGATRDAVSADNSEAVVVGSTAKNAGRNGYRTVAGKIVAIDGDGSDSGTGSGFSIARGGIIVKTNADGSVSHAVNTLHPNGIIFE